MTVLAVADGCASSKQRRSRRVLLRQCGFWKEIATECTRERSTLDSADPGNFDKIKSAVNPSWAFSLPSKSVLESLDEPLTSSALRYVPLPHFR